jgi:hypothetical protein
MVDNWIGQVTLQDKRKSFKSKMTKIFVLSKGLFTLLSAPVHLTPQSNYMLPLPHHWGRGVGFGQDHCMGQNVNFDLIILRFRGKGFFVCLAAALLILLYTIQSCMVQIIADYIAGRLENRGANE